MNRHIPRSVLLHGQQLPFPGVSSRKSRQRLGNPALATLFVKRDLVGLMSQLVYHTCRVERVLRRWAGQRRAGQTRKRNEQGERDNRARGKHADLKNNRCTKTHEKKSRSTPRPPFRHCHRAAPPERSRHHQSPCVRWTRVASVSAAEHYLACCGRHLAP